MDAFDVTNRYLGTRGLTISGASYSSSERRAAVSLLFSQGTRPCARDISALAEGAAAFSISLDPSTGPGGDPQAGGWLELLTSGLTFDLNGLAPGPAAERPPYRYSLGVDQEDLHTLEAITLVPGPHLSGGAGILPIIRTLAALGGSLSRIEGVRAVAWHSSRCWCEPRLYRAEMERWTQGGVFPALMLTSLVMAPDGGMQSEGLALITGQELRLEPEMVGDPTEASKLAVRLVDHLVELGKVGSREIIAGPDGAPLRLDPSPNGQFVRISHG